jgi:hypothetical protein
MDSNYNKQGNFPDPLASPDAKASKSYGMKYAKAIESQWGHTDDHGSIFRKRLDEFERYRDYANGTQDTKIYKQILNSLDPNNGDGSLLNIDWSPVPIIPKFVKIVVNKILSKNPYPNVEAIDPLSITEKERKKAELKFNVENKEMLQQAKMAGLEVGAEIERIPDTPEEAEIFLESNIKTSAEIAAQIAANLTLEWNEYNHTVHRRAVTDLVSVGMGVTKNDYDPNYGLVTKYVDPAYFIHSYTEDPLMNDLTYAGHIKRITISELRRLAGDDFTEEEYRQMATNVQNKYANDPNKLSHSYYDRNLQRTIFGYDEYIVEVMDFEFLSVDDVFYESKESRFGNVGFYYKGMMYQPPKESVFDRKPIRMSFVTLYGGSYIVGTNKIYGYGMKNNQPRNIHDITRTRLSYSAVAVNMRRMIPKSMVSGIVGFADQLQITHLKIQQSIAKAKPDGLIIDIEGLENVQLGQGGELQPLEIQDIYEQTGIFYYRSKNPEGGFQNPPIREIGNAIRNIEAYVNTYNHYLRMIRDATGINEVVDASTPKGDALVGVRQQAIEASNNATYDITHASMMLYKKVVEYIVKCVQIMPPQSVIYSVYENAIGKSNMDVLASFKDLPMYNFGVRVVPEMSDADKAYLEANIQQSIAQGEIDLEDAMAIRRLKDVDQAEQLLIVRRKKRIKMRQDIAAQNSQMQAQMNQQTAQASAQAEAQTEQVKSALELEKIKLEATIKLDLLEREYALKIDLAKAEAAARMEVNQEDRDFRMGIESKREQAKDERVKKQAVEQSKLISQRKGERGELTDEENDLLTQIIGNQ